jgi:hypothetical protein
MYEIILYSKLEAGVGEVDRRQLRDRDLQEGIQAGEATAVSHPIVFAKIGRIQTKQLANGIQRLALVWFVTEVLARGCCATHALAAVLRAMS